MLAIAPRCSSRTAASLLILALLSLLPLPLRQNPRQNPLLFLLLLSLRQHRQATRFVS